MLDVLALVAPIFLAIAVGYGCVRSGLVAGEAVRGLSGFVLYVAMPALIVNAFVRNPMGELFDASYVLAYGGASAVVFGLGFALTRLRGGDTGTAALSALGMSSSNSGFVGYPLAALVVGAPAVAALALCMVVENFLMIPLALALAEGGARAGAPLGTILRASAGRLGANPIILAIAVGLLLSLTGLRPPAPLLKVLEMFALASAPVALFVIGGSLVGLRTAGLVGRAGPIVAGKLLLHPAAVFLGLKLVPEIGPGLAKAGVLMAAMPMLGIYPILGQRYGLERMCSAALLAATVASVATVSAVIWLLGG